MADALFILIVIGFFGLMVLLVKACDRIIGPDELSSDTSDSSGSSDESTAPEEVGAR